ncbi:hypothetical protein ACNKHN_07520 [Shigella flexneri]
MASRRFVSAERSPLIALEMTIMPLYADASVLISKGILTPRSRTMNASIPPNPGAVFGQHLMQGIYHRYWRSDVAISCCCQASGDVQQCYTAKRAPFTATYQYAASCRRDSDVAKTGVDRLADDRQAALDEWGSVSLRQLNVRATELRPTSCSIDRKLASMVAETSYHGKWRRCARY